ncbi:DUF2497 domain-containing protein [Hyphomonas johnsonii]|uniref:Pole-organizing protein PopZ n=1 Tax=Hyphomonas johnsonii MHS-2 TaxID=1280950 RepID=A0A059FRH2_9PROT|nr:DUF2497 domain-containing protein [Hyphomonas johnsonii]KCZ93274.1 hypothetical protein HJO_05445 [Hyphomonas johnsonii MHS-2]
MANEAHKEPTMEEILASIRKIISEDDAATAKRPGAPTPVVQDDPVDTLADNDDVDDLSFETAEEEIDQAMFEEESDNDFVIEEAEPVEESSFDVDDSSAGASFEDVLGAVREITDAHDAMPVHVSVPEPEPEPTPEPYTPPPMETKMPASARYQETVLTNDQTADAAAGSLGKLISRMELGDENTIGGLVRELLKPMIKEWLDANLASIVEEKVEAEVQRIARMAR